MSLVVDKNDLIPRYLQVRGIIERKIRTGEIPLGFRIPSERDLAQSLGVSQMTVNKAVALMVRDGWLRRELGNGTFVEETLDIPTSKDVTIGFALPQLSASVEEDYFVGALLRGVQKAAISRPLNLRMLDAHSADLAEEIEKGELDGCIVVDLRDEHREAIQKLAQLGRRILLLGASDVTVNTPFVDGDNMNGTAAAVKHLLGLGHRRIVGIFALMETWNSKQRHLSFMNTLSENGTPANPEHVLLDEGNGRLLTPETKVRLADLLGRRQGPTAVLCGGYFLALQAMHLISELGLRIPDDVSIVGYDDPVSARYLNPPLTTVRQPLEEMGEQSVINLYDWVRSRASPPPPMILKESLVVRLSTAKV